jgi:hypothetical protein
VSNAENKRLARRYHEDVFTRRDLTALDELFAADCIGNSASAGTYILADTRRDIAHEHEDMREDATIIDEQVAEADRVVTRWR